MRQLFLGIFLFFNTSIYAAVVDSMFVMGADYKLLHISNHHCSGYLYAENYQHQKILIYKSDSPYPPDSTFSSNQIDGTDILDIGFNCHKDTCNRYLNRRTNQLSEIYSSILDYDAKKDVVAFYQKDENKVIISRAFKVCSKPLTYFVKLEEDSDFGIKTKFLSNGGLQLDYEVPDGKDIIKIIHLNYGKLLSDCG
ncbi:MAG: hypothetical protein JSR33_10880 [Proteobacteria bacterium]|nr:hypothetical protein [Pseudomonadota bacterium]